MKALVILYVFVCCGRVLCQDNPCPASKPCSCGSRGTQIINCAGHGLPNVPSFSPVNNAAFRELRLSRNNITVIKASAFAVLNVTSILLDYNRITTIDLAAFSGVSTYLQTLNLAHNQLRILPQALTSTNLKELDVSWNPIPGYKKPPHGRGTDGLTDSVMRFLGSNMIKFAFGDSSLTSWPRSLTHLNRLEELRLSGANITYLPSNAFHGFEQTLNKLTIEYASLAAVPLAISSLTGLEELHLDHLNVPGRDGITVYFDDMSMTSAPFTPIADTLRILSLEYDGLTTFPEVISELTALENISLSGNNLEFISDEAIELLKHSEVTILSLRKCNLKRIPGSISDLGKLKSLDFSENEIRSIESTDLQNLYTLKTLFLNKNPLRYISDDSLCGLNNLTELNLYNSSLKELSKSLKNLGKLEVLDLRESSIDCTCDLTWFKQWMDIRGTCNGHKEKNQTLDILGNCETIDEGIMRYINERLRTCPDYTGNCETIDEGIMRYINERLRTCPDYTVPTATAIPCHGNCNSRK